MTTSTQTQSLNDRYAQAWDDLGSRIESGIDTLSALAAERPGDQRLKDKTEGLRDAKYLYEAIDRDFFPFTDFPGGIYGYQWTTFTSRVFGAYTRAMGESRGDFGSGLSLALEYQRGYGSDVDAPSLNVLMMRNR